MNGAPKVHRYQSLRTLAQRLRSDVKDINCILLYAYNRTPYFHHVATLAELRRCVETGNLYTFHFNALRSILERTASFLGHDDLRICLEGLEDEALYNRALNLLSHGKYSITEPVEMVDDNKDLFRKILTDVVDKFGFAVPDLAPAAPKTKANP